MSTLAVIFGGPSPEHDVSILTGLQAGRALLEAGHQVEAIYWTKSQDFLSVDPASEAASFIDGVPRGASELQLVAQSGGGFQKVKGGLLGSRRPLTIEAVLNCCHGGPGEDGTLQGALDMAGVAYTGPSAAGAAVGMDKLAFGALVAGAGLPSLPRYLVSPTSTPPREGGPFILKPRFGGSSIGIEIVEDWQTALNLVAAGGVHTRRGMIAEPYLPESVDLNVALRMWPSPQLSAIEKPLRGTGSTDILGYRDKYLGGEGMVSAPRELPASLPDALEKSLREAALSVAEIAGVRGVARLDFLLDGDRWWVNELNTIPGSLAKYLWVGASAVEFSALLSDMVSEASARPSSRWDSTGADGLALRSASSIASKLG